MKHRPFMDWFVMYIELAVIVAICLIAYVAQSTLINVVVALCIPIPLGFIVHIWRTP